MWEYLKIWVGIFRMGIFYSGIHTEDGGGRWLVGIFGVNIFRVWVFLIPSKYISFRLTSIHLHINNHVRVNKHVIIDKYFNGHLIRCDNLQSTHRTSLKGTLWCLRQFLTAESPLKKIKNAFYFTLKPPFVLKIYKFLSWIFGHVGKQLD